LTAGRRAKRMAERVIGRACRRLAGDIGDERYREWTAELPAIVSDPHIRSGLLRSARALRYAAGSYRSARYLRRAAGLSRRDVRQARHAGSVAGGWASSSRSHPPGRLQLPDGVVPAAAAVLTWLMLVALINAYPPSGSWNYLYAAASIVPVSLAVTAIFIFVRSIRRQSRHPRP
jgi:hypothetical protein